MQIPKQSLIKIAFTLIALATPTSLNAQSPGKLFTVDFNGDTVDVTPGDGRCLDAAGRCSLRAAIEEANTASRRDVITFALPNPSVIDLTLGELVVASQVSIIGPGARRLTVQRSFAPGTPDFRVFRIPPYSGPALIRGLTIRNGRIANALFGGGLYVEQGSALSITEVTVRDNWALYGGGLANWGGVDITRSLFTGNRGNNWAGAIYNIHHPGPRLRIMNSTITMNSAAAHGAISNDGTLVLVNNTITHNSADDITSGIASYSEGTIHILNTIVGSDTSPTLTSLGGSFVSLGNNIITDARNSTGFVNGVNNDQVSDNNAINPLLGPLANNGGQTDTRALLTGSPAINSGSNCVVFATCPVVFPLLPSFSLSSDQRRGHGRRAGATVDVGAFESGSTEASGSSSLAFGLFSPRAGYTGSIAVLTDSITNEKRYAAVNAFGKGTFQNIPAGVYVLEIRSKRTGYSAVVVVEHDNNFTSGRLLIPSPGL